VVVLQLHLAGIKVSVLEGQGRNLFKSRVSFRSALSQSFEGSTVPRSIINSGCRRRVFIRCYQSFSGGTDVPGATPKKPNSGLITGMSGDSLCDLDCAHRIQVFGDASSGHLSQTEAVARAKALESQKADGFSLT
jgi:hypothetical protein